uniref:DM domain-containing protein n=1 Tax=Ditylenchus dipsaci TaxID=166011 RepID=A0A915CZ68_9BILA
MSVKSPQRYFAISKRVPKNVLRYCGICRQHGEKEETRGHICRYKDCDCTKCHAVRERRHVMSKQIKLRRAQEKCFQRTTDATEADLIPLVTNISLAAQSSGASDQLLHTSATDPSAVASANMLDAKNMCYFCQKCKNHGSVVYKKNHKRQCPYVDCTCDSCDLIETRRKLDQNIKQKKANQKGSADNISSIKSSSSTEFSCNTSSSAR